MNYLAREESRSSLPEIGISGPGMAQLLRSVLARGVNFRFTASGSSMIPFIRSEDILLISPVAEAMPAFGQVVAFEHPVSGNLVVHRLVGRRRAGCLLRGDNYAVRDLDTIPNEYILGVVASIERSGATTCLGLGIERIPIALLSRFSLLTPLLRVLSSVKHFGAKIFRRAAIRPS